jgi:hypothetical protein
MRIQYTVSYRRWPVMALPENRSWSPPHFNLTYHALTAEVACRPAPGGSSDSSSSPGPFLRVAHDLPGLLARR